MVCQVSLLCLIGVPAAGKSSFAKQLKSFLSGILESNFIHIISFDELIGPDEFEVSWKSKRQQVLESVSLIIDSIPFNGKSFNLIILDDNMYYRSMRYEYVKLAREKKVGFCQVYLNAPLNQAILFNNKRDQPVPENIMYRMHEKLEVPNCNTFYWEKHSLVCDAYQIERVVLEKVHDLVIESMKCPMETPTSSLAQTEHLSDHTLQRAELALRLIVKRELQEFTLSKDEVIRLGPLLASKKKHIFSGIKEKQIKLPDIPETEDISNEQILEQYVTYLKPFFAD